MNKPENKMMCFANKDVDFKQFGFEKDGIEWEYWYNNTKRMYFNIKDYRVYFNCMITQVLKVFFDMAVAGAIRFEVYPNEHRMYLTDEEYKVIQEMRKAKNDQERQRTYMIFSSVLIILIWCINIAPLWANIVCTILLGLKFTKEFLKKYHYICSLYDMDQEVGFYI